MNDLFPDDLARAKARDQQAAAKALLEHDELRRFEADFTPRMVARTILAWYFAHVLRMTLYRPRTDGCPGCESDGAAHTCPDPLTLLTAKSYVLSRPTKVLRILDVCAGAGVWASEFRRLAAELGFDVHITAVEWRASEAENLRRWADVTVIGDWREFALQCEANDIRFDLVIGNPAFTLARAQDNPNFDKSDKTIDEPEYLVETSMPAVFLRSVGALMLYMSQQAWTKTATGFEVRRVYPPAYAVDVPGSVSHRTGKNPKNGKRYGADSIPYSACMWLGRRAGIHAGLTSTGMLEPLDGRSWREGLRPGAEPDEWCVSEGLPMVEGVVSYLPEGGVLDLEVMRSGPAAPRQAA